MHADFPRLVEAGAGAQRADELRRRDGARFDVGREPDAEQPALLARGLLLGTEFLVVEHLEHAVPGGAVVAAVVGDGDVRLVSARELRDEVLRPLPGAPAHASTPISIT